MIYPKIRASFNASFVILALLVPSVFEEHVCVFLLGRLLRLWNDNENAFKHLSSLTFNQIETECNVFFLIGPQEQTWTRRETFGMRFIVMLVEDVEQWKHWGRQAGRRMEGGTVRSAETGGLRLEAETGDGERQSHWSWNWPSSHERESLEYSNGRRSNSSFKY